MKLSEFSAKELSRMLREKKCSSVEITTDVLNNIKEKDETINAYITVMEDEALKQAKEVDVKLANNEGLSDLAGIPIGIKDNICVKGTLTTCASKILSNFA